MKTKIWISALLILAATGFAWHTWGGAAVAAVAGALVMWLLLHYTRLMKIMQRAAQRPIGTVSNAVMLNARLAQGQTLMKTIGMTQSLGQSVGQSVASTPAPSDTGFETFVWTDASGDSVTVSFKRGKLQRWHLTRAQSGT